MSDLSNYLDSVMDPETHEPGSFGRFATNLVSNVNELGSGTVDAINNGIKETAEGMIPIPMTDEEIKLANEYDIIRRNPDKYYIPPDQLEKYKAASEKMAQNMGVATNFIPAGGQIRTISEIGKPLTHISFAKIKQFINPLLKYEGERVIKNPLINETTGYGGGIVNGKGINFSDDPNFSKVVHQLNIRQGSSDYVSPMYAYTAEHKPEVGHKLILDLDQSFNDLAKEMPDLAQDLEMLQGNYKTISPDASLKANNHGILAALATTIYEKNNRLITRQQAMDQAQYELNQLLKDYGFGASTADMTGSYLQGNTTPLRDYVTYDANDLDIKNTEPLYWGSDITKMFNDYRLNRR